MEHFCCVLNNALERHFAYTYLPFKVKYYRALVFLQNLNCISGFNIQGTTIKVFLRYVNNMPLFRLQLFSSSGGRMFIRNSYLKNTKNESFDCVRTFSSSKFGYSVIDPLLFFGLGGELAFSVCYFSFSK